MQDNDPKHTSKLCQRYIKSKEEQHVLQLMSWPVQLADLTPIELLWNKLDWKVKINPEIQLTSGKESWKELFLVYLQSLIEKMQKICEPVIAAKGGHILMNQKFEFFCIFLV